MTYAMFRDCVSLETLKTGPLFVSDYVPDPNSPHSGVRFKEMFMNCSSLRELDLRNIYIRGDLLDCYLKMLSGCTGLTRLGVNETLVAYECTGGPGVWLNEEAGERYPDLRSLQKSVTGKAMLNRPETSGTDPDR